MQYVLTANVIPKIVKAKNFGSGKLVRSLELQSRISDLVSLEELGLVGESAAERRYLYSQYPEILLGKELTL